MDVGSGDSNEEEKSNKLSESVKADEKCFDNSKTEALEEKLEELHVHVKSETEIGSHDTDDKHEHNDDKEVTDIDKSQETVDNTNTVLGDSGNVEKTDNEKLEGCDETTCDTVNNVDDSGEQMDQAEGAGKTDDVKQEKGPKVWTEKSLKAEWRRFNLDLSPKVYTVKIQESVI